jgi:MYXO-CTERM domain-containing protein
VLALVGGAACGDGANNTDSSGDTIYAGQIDDDGNGNPSVVSIKIGTSPSFELCTGALIAPNLVLTARHCMSKVLKDSISCDAAGESGNGDQVGDDDDLAIIQIFSGAHPVFLNKPVAKASQLVHPAGAILCNQDIALIVLDTAVPNVPTLKVRVARGVDADEVVRAVGFGQNDQSVPIGTRLRKDGLHVLAVGEGMSKSQTPLGSHEFELGKSICQGDSGGPAISEKTGAVVGVVSRGGDCSDDFGHIYTMTGAFQPLLAQAFDAAGADLSAASEDPSAVGAGGTGDGTGSGDSPASSGGGGSAQSGGGHACSAGRSEARGAGWLALLVLGVFFRRRRGSFKLGREEDEGELRAAPLVRLQPGQAPERGVPFVAAGGGGVGSLETGDTAGRAAFG